MIKIETLYPPFLHKKNPTFGRDGKRGMLNIEYTILALNHTTAGKAVG
jgi:hypothetical protein